MRALEFGWEEHLHGIQVGIGTILSLKVYEYLRTVKPNKEKALATVAAFSVKKWEEEIYRFLGKSAQNIIALEQKERKFDPVKHSVRLDIIIDKWPIVQQIIAEELPAAKEISNLLKKLGAKTTPEELGIDIKTVKQTFITTKDIRDKYIGSRLLWDLGLLEEAAEKLFM